MLPFEPSSLIAAVADGAGALGPAMILLLALFVLGLFIGFIARWQRLLAFILGAYVALGLMPVIEQALSRTDTLSGFFSGGGSGFAALLSLLFLAAGWLIHFIASFRYTNIRFPKFITTVLLAVIFTGVVAVTVFISVGWGTLVPSLASVDTLFSKPLVAPAVLLGGLASFLLLFRAGEV